MLRNTTIMLTCWAAVACGQSLQDEDAATFQARVDSAIATSDTSKLASLAERRCEGLGSDAKQTCLEDYFLSLSGEGRVRLALTTLEKVGNDDRSVAADGHGYTHIIGIKAWRPGDDVGKVFRSCTSLYQSGCYHGVLQSYLTATGDIDSARVVGLCDKIAPAGTDNWIRFQCMHGIGHGLDMSWRWDLPRALRGCDWLATPWDQDSCYGGAIMENSVASMTGGHHMAQRALEKSDSETNAESGEHGHDAMAMAMPMSGPPVFKMRDSTDALYPCTALGARYQQACYLGQGSIILDAVDRDFGRAAKECDRAPVTVRKVCYMSLGTNASGATVMNTPKSIEYCSAGDPDWRKWCFVGVVKNFIDVTSDPDKGIAFCKEVPEGQDRDACWRAVGEELAVLHTTDLKSREAGCAGAGDGEALCRAGAGVSEKH